MDELKKETIEKWNSILSSQNDYIMGTDPAMATQSQVFPSLLPIARKISAKTIGSEIGGWATQEEKDKIIQRVKQENRSGKIDEVLNDIEYKETKLEDDPEYKEACNRGIQPMGGPSVSLIRVQMYLDFIYDGGQTASITPS